VYFKKDVRQRFQPILSLYATQLFFQLNKAPYAQKAVAPLNGKRLAAGQK
jgi:hypothetical protein